jgi:hypothetical protein
MNRVSQRWFCLDLVREGAPEAPPAQSGLKHPDASYREIRRARGATGALSPPNTSRMWLMGRHGFRIVFNNLTLRRRYRARIVGYRRITPFIKSRYSLLANVRSSTAIEHSVSFGIMGSEFLIVSNDRWLYFVTRIPVIHFLLA